jgi:hypothetical protein
MFTHKVLQELIFYNLCKNEKFRCYKISIYKNVYLFYIEHKKYLFSIELK